MSIFNDKALKGVAEAAAKIMAETSHGTHPKTPKEKSLAALAHPKDKITHKDVLVGRGVLKKEEKEQLDELSKKTLGSYIKKANARQTDDYHDAGSMDVEPERRDGIARTEKINRAVDKLVSKKTNEEVEQLQEYESKDGKYTHKGTYGREKGAQYGESDYSKGGEEEKELNKKEKSPKRAQKGYGPHQNKGMRGLTTGEKKKVNESLSFTEMLELYNEHGLKVLAPIEKEEQQIGDQTVEVIDADKVNGVVDTIVEEPTEEEFNKELKDQQDSFAGKKKQPKVAAGKTTGVKVMPEEVELDERTLTPAETAKKEQIVKSMKKGLAGFKQRYGERAKEVMYATATKQAKKD
jgi:hypothetical protein